MFTIWGIILLAAGVFVGLFAPRLLPALGNRLAAAYLGTALVVLGAGLQVYDAWWKLPPQCRLVLSLSCDAGPAQKSRRR